ncbi:MAG: tripartite tricarboxylate transporter substrate binding protein [Betaproteobacteria bacterium]|nr:tripartite tricarboxylate transporter substrate binding protein [Betaproteobacteria bacterium]MBI3937316.1 tripartite tricarboxylate transporter substrate binding protein [Betaproteobacteria bacterium]
MRGLMRRTWMAAAIAIAVIWPEVTVAQAAQYPTRPVRLINPFSPGGAVDLVARTVAQKMTESWGQPVIVDNRPGAGTMIGTDIVVRAAPDGYTLLLTSAVIATNVTLYPQQRDPLTELAPIALVVQAPFVLAVHPSLPAKSVRELINLAKAKPRQVAYGSAGAGTTTHLMLELFKSLASIDMLHVPYKGGGPAVNALVGGEVQATFLPITVILPQARAGRVRALGVSSAKRAELAPELPTVAEAGLPGFDAAGWYAMFAPAGTPRSIVGQINAEVNRALQLPDVRERFLTNGMVSFGGAPGALADYLKLEIARWAKVIKEAKIKPE